MTPEAAMMSILVRAKERLPKLISCLIPSDSAQCIVGELAFDFRDENIAITSSDDDLV